VDAGGAVDPAIAVMTRVDIDLLVMARATRENRQGHKTGQYEGNRFVTEELGGDPKFFSLVPCPSESHPLTEFQLRPVDDGERRTITQTVPEPPMPGGGLPPRSFMILLLAGGEEEDQGKSPSKRSATHGRDLVRTPTR